MMKIQAILFTSCLALSTCYRMLPKTPAGAGRFFPVELRFPGQIRYPTIRIPNEKFCAEMQLHPAEHYMVLPWWYNYCTQLFEKQEKRFSDSGYENLAMYRSVLNNVQTYKKLKNGLM